ncbi:hypothetical protein KO481_21710 [Nocardia sp. NEAU-G5]|uniref:Uncharacterized protein n=1 Tax=Nocardia albiluteola TaxID=2842303 RepID=A0ABS6B1H2_9NOCA|nr:hypothetical protein [Nocardia albiluteola]MBU3064137.1 hypothetical protein [Nocardia albiluteola]
MSVMHALLVQSVDAAQHYQGSGILRKIRNGVLIFLLVVFLIGLFIGLFVGYAIGKSAGRR